MLCSNCGANVDPYAPFCSTCGEPTPEQSFRAEDLREISAWRIQPVSREALILGNPSNEDDEIATLGLELPSMDGESSFTVYSTNAKHLNPFVTLERAASGDLSNLTPYERFVLDLVTRPSTVEEIERSSPLAHDELNASLLTLLDRGALRVAGEGAAPRKSMPAPAPRPSMPAPAPAKPSAWPAPAPVPAPVAATTSMPARPSMPPPSVPRPSMPPPVPARPSMPPVAVVPRPSMPPVAAAPVAQRPVEAKEVAVPRRTVEVPLPADHRARARIRERASVAPPAPSSVPVAPTMTFNQRKAADLAAAGRDDLKSGNIVSARMNLKIALSFDPENRDIQELFREAMRDDAKKPLPRARSRVADRLLAQAAEAEEKNDVPKAIALLEQALKEGEDPVVLNRLGVILALKGKQIGRGQQLLEKAVELDPKNPTYSNNLGKVIGLVAERFETAQAKGGSGGSGGNSGGGSFWSRLKKK